MVPSSSLLERKNSYHRSCCTNEDKSEAFEKKTHTHTLAVQQRNTERNQRTGKCYFQLATSRRGGALGCRGSGGKPRMDRCESYIPIQTHTHTHTHTRIYPCIGAGLIAIAIRPGRASVIDHAPFKLSFPGPSATVLPLMLWPVPCVGCRAFVCSLCARVSSRADFIC